MRYVWALVALLYAVLNIYVGYLFITTAATRLGHKGLMLQAPPLLGGIALALLALPVVWNCIRLATARIES